MRSSRLLSILLRLQMRGRCTAADLAAEFEVAVRTIYRDLDALSAAGVPVHAERGRGGGMVLARGWRTSLTGLTEQEARSLPLAGLADAMRDLGWGVEAADVQLKLLASLPPMRRRMRGALPSDFMWTHCRGITAPRRCRTCRSWRRRCGSAPRARGL
ncbi:helix-turn-helix transcriptional regulator [Ideonella paludis]|uniref:helix-turn-helix transcriptional regulator n=1 Tax=Ideonella paludis TaxID=1233411 RepID=UPI00362C3371